MVRYRTRCVSDKSKRRPEMLRAASKFKYRVAGLVKPNRLVCLARADRRGMPVAEQNVHGNVTVVHIADLCLRVTIPVQRNGRVANRWKQCSRIGRVERRAG